MESAFWVVWKSGGGVPTVRHQTALLARREAERLARENPGEEFHVLQAVGVACVPMIFREFDDIPF